LKVHEYTVVLEREAEGGYSAWVPDLPGCASQGDTYKQALRNIREAAECYLEALHKLGKRAPKARARIDTLRVQAA
jgi:predicted RNase H-like HicB family nuclease